MRVLMHCLGWSGHVHPTLAVARALQQRGHAVAILTASAHRARVAAAGIAAFTPSRAPDRDFDRLHDEFPALPGLPNAEVLARVLWEREVAEAPRDGHDVALAAAEWRADLLVNDGIALGVPLAAGVQRLPWATLSPFLFCTIPDPALPTPFLGLPLPNGLAGRWGAHAAERAAELRLAAASRRWRALAREWRVPSPAPSVRWAGCSPLLYLYPGGAPLEYPRRRSMPHVHAVGPLIHDHAAAPPLGPASRPRVVVTEGTTHTDLLLPRLAIRALGRADLELLLVLGRAERVLDPLPPNARAFAYVSYRAVLQGATLLITNGGAGSLVAALEAGVPSVILPAGLDKAEAAERMVHAGAGIRLPAPSRCSEARLRSAVATVRAEPHYRERATAVGWELLALGGAERAATLLEGLVARR